LLELFLKQKVFKKLKKSLKIQRKNAAKKEKKVVKQL
jgi:hypothetical protein